MDVTAARSTEELAHRAFDLTAATVGLVILSPLLLLVAVLVKASSPGPVFFQQERVGKDGKTFKILKFRTMVVGAEAKGRQLTVGDDPRLTSVGRWIRTWKLDELPQLINVVQGEMALVGPRPEVPRYVALYTPAQRRVLSVRPGLTDPASIAYRNESELMATHPEPERLYISQIMPRKLEINLDYLAQRTFASDLHVIFDTLKAVAGAKTEP